MKIKDGPEQKRIKGQLGFELINDRHQASHVLQIEINFGNLGIFHGNSL